MIACDPCDLLRFTVASNDYMEFRLYKWLLKMPTLLYCLPDKLQGVSGFSLQTKSNESDAFAENQTLHWL